MVPADPDHVGDVRDDQGEREEMRRVARPQPREESRQGGRRERVESELHRRREHVADAGFGPAAHVLRVVRVGPEVAVVAPAPEEVEADEDREGRDERDQLSDPEPVRARALEHEPGEAATEQHVRLGARVLARRERERRDDEQRTPVRRRPQAHDREQDEERELSRLESARRPHGEGVARAEEEE